MDKTGNLDRVYFKNLDVLRFLSAFLVLIHHHFQYYEGKFGSPSFIHFENNAITQSSGWLKNFFENGMIGVDMFFLISGFLITYLLFTEKERNGTIKLGNFYRRRALRILPLYFLTLALAPLICNLMNHAGPSNYSSSVFFFGNFHMASIMDWDLFPVSHLWSICVEEHFYLIWPLVIILIPKQWFPSICMALIFFSLLYRAYIFSYSPNWYRLYLDTGCRVDTLIIGSWAGYSNLYFPSQPRATKTLRIVLLFIILLLLISGLSFKWDTVFEVMFKKYIYICITGYLMHTFLFHEKPLFTIGQKNILHYLGKISYGIYMFGALTGPLFFKMYPSSGRWTNNYFVSLILYAIFIILLSIISYELFEKTYLRLKSKFEIIKTRP